MRTLYARVGTKAVRASMVADVSRRPIARMKEGRRRRKKRSCWHLPVAAKERSSKVSPVKEEDGEDMDMVPLQRPEENVRVFSFGRSGEESGNFEWEGGGETSVAIYHKGNSKALQA